MIKPTESDFDYIITDMEGIIDNVSRNMMIMLKLNNNQQFKEKETPINIMILMPELIPFFLDT